MFKIGLILVGLVSANLKAEIRPIPDNENIYPLLEKNIPIRSLNIIKNDRLESGSTEIDLWSGHYWPHFQGSLAIRYRDTQFQGLIDDKEQFDKFKELAEKKPLYTYAGQESLLSPAEKYDLLVGDNLFTLTKYSWEQGQKAQTLGRVPTWRGICDGWSSAAQMMPRPSKTVVLKSPQGTPITFYPEDIKALGSLLYAKAQDRVIFLGKRCYSAVVGLFTGACQGTNPAAFHLALANRVGKLKKTFIADVSTSSEVWNYPIKDYKFTYYNVLTDEETSDFQNAIELFTKKHRFNNPGKRHDRTHAILGVKAVVTYTDMRPAHTLNTDGSEQDKVMTKEYYYDLEVDRQMNVLGGEWASNNAPDFIWAPNDKIYPLSDGELSRIPTTPEEILKAAKVSSKNGQPLSVIVEKLFEASR